LLQILESRAYRVATLNIGELLNLSLIVEDTGAGTTDEALQRGRSTGVGLRNVERRLECQYGHAASLSIRTVPGEGTHVEIRMPVDLKVSADRDAHRVAR
jgi:sensor histidine kinase YesM